VSEALPQLAELLRITPMLPFLYHENRDSSISCHQPDFNILHDYQGFL